MPFDGGVIVGYLAAAVGKKVADRAINGLLDYLARRVQERLGRAPLGDLRRRPDDPRVRAHVDRAVQQAASADPAFAYDLARVQAELDQRGARYLVGDIYAPHGNVAVGHGATAIGNVYAQFRHPSDMRDAPAWAKTLMALGFLICLAGMGLFGYTIFTDQPEFGDPDFGRPPQGIGVAAGVFFTGFVIAAIGAIGAGMSRDRY
jgi:hypothetical protein